MSLELVEWAASWPMVLPYFEGKVPAGFPSPAEDYLETPLDLTEYLIENKAATFMMRVDGDSMKDAGILDGDLLVVDRAAKPVNGSVVVVAVNGEYTVKRLRRGPDCVWLDPGQPSLSAPPCLAGGRAACLRRRQARNSHDAMSHGRGLRAHRLQQLLRLLRARLPSRSRRGSRHRALEQRWLRRRKVVGLCGICTFVNFSRHFK